MGGMSATTFKYAPDIAGGARPLKALWRGVCTPVMLLGQHNARA